MQFDSSVETLKHIKRVTQLAHRFVNILLNRAEQHDKSKLEEPEKSAFDEYTSKLKDCTYGSEEYKSFLKEMNITLQHHYENNSHHPQYYTKGLYDFDLFDLVEMFIDWKAATERHKDGNILASIKINTERFNINSQLSKILENTALRYYCFNEEKGEDNGI